MVPAVCSVKQHVLHLLLSLFCSMTCDMREISHFKRYHSVHRFSKTHLIPCVITNLIPVGIYQENNEWRIPGCLDHTALLIGKPAESSASPYGYDPWEPSALLYPNNFAPSCLKILTYRPNTRGNLCKNKTSQKSFHQTASSTISDQPPPTGSEPSSLSCKANVRVTGMRPSRYLDTTQEIVQ